MQYKMVNIMKKNKGIRSTHNQSAIVGVAGYTSTCRRPCKSDTASCLAE